MGGARTTRRAVRTARVDQEVKKALSQIIANEVKDDRLGPLTSVTRVEVTRDLKHAKVFVSVGDQKHAMSALAHASSFIRGRLAKVLPFRRAPELTFVQDKSVDHSVRIAQLLAEVNPASDEEDLEVPQPDQEEEWEEDEGADSFTSEEDEDPEDLDEANSEEAMDGRDTEGVRSDGEIH